MLLPQWEALSITTGLVEAADNEAELASVLAHEIGHIASRHSVEQETSDPRGVATAAILTATQRFRFCRRHYSVSSRG